MKTNTCNLKHRIKRELVVNGHTFIAFQCCDSRECLFKSSEGGMSFCKYDDLPVDTMTDDGVSKPSTGEQKNG